MEKDRYLGCLIDLAVGDALGITLGEMEKPDSQKTLIESMPEELFKLV